MTKKKKLNDDQDIDLRIQKLKKILEEKWKTIGISDDFVFCKVMQDKKLLKELLNRILPDLKIKKLHIEAQKVIEMGKDIHGVRFDVFATLEDGSTIDIEMQVLNNENLPKRLRYYGAMSDMQMLEKGVPYGKLMDSYVIIICPFDLYGEGRHIYTFTNRCKQNHELEMGDGATKIVLNAVGMMDDVSHELKVFLDYVAGKPAEDEYIQELDKAVIKARANKKWRREYMNINMRDLEHEEMGREKHKREQIAELLTKGKTPEEIADFCGYPMDLIQKVQENMLVEK